MLTLNIGEIEIAKFDLMTNGIFVGKIPMAKGFVYYRNVSRCASSSSERNLPRSNEPERLR
jgi:hypothetical protein